MLCNGVQQVQTVSLSVASERHITSMTVVSAQTTVEFPRLLGVPVESPQVQFLVKFKHARHACVLSPSCRCPCCALQRACPVAECRVIGGTAVIVYLEVFIHEVPLVISPVIQATGRRIVHNWVWFHLMLTSAHCRKSSMRKLQNCTFKYSVRRFSFRSSRGFRRVSPVRS